MRNPLAVLGGLFRWSYTGPQDISQDPTKSLLAALGGEPTAAGVAVNETTAEGMPAVYAAVHFLADIVASLPLKLMRKQADGGLDDATDHPLYDVLRYLSSPELTAFELRDTLQTSLGLWGNAYAEVTRNARGQVVALWPLDPSRMESVERDGLSRLRYTYRLADGTAKVYTFDANRPPLLHIRINAAPTGILGRSPIRIHRETLGLARAADNFGARFFANQARPSGILQAKTSLSPEAIARLRKQWEGMQQGDRQLSTAILEEGMTWQSITIPPEDAQFIETRRYQLDEIARIYRIPPHMLGAVDRSTSWGSGIEQQAIGFKTFTLMPLLERWKQAIKRDLLNRQEFNAFELVWDTSELLRGDAISRAQALATMRQNGVLSANEWRQSEGMDPISEQDGGNTYLVNGNMVPAKAAEDLAAANLAQAEAPAPTPAPEAETEDDDDAEDADEGEGAE